MDITFMSIHDLSDDARILYASDSVFDLLGYTPVEILYRPVWDYFHPDEIPFARQLHSNSVSLDKAAVLAYCRLKHKDGHWEGCEVSFSICHDVLVVCTSIYSESPASRKRATDAPAVQKLFTPAVKDPRYDMLAHLSSKFTQPSKDQTPEPRAALFLNRFTQTLTIMYATTAIEDIIDMSSEAICGRSFYACIQERCLEDAVRCLETAKSNDSIAYLRFWFRDPRQNDVPVYDSSADEITDTEMTDATVSDDNDDDDNDTGTEEVHTEQPSRMGEVSREEELRSRARTTNGWRGETASESHRAGHGDPPLYPSLARLAQEESGLSGTSSAQSGLPAETRNAIFGAASTGTSTSLSSAPPSQANSASSDRQLELEAVVSCTSDGLVVCLRRAKPLQLPFPQMADPAAQAYGYPRGLFAAPWARNPAAMPPPPRPEPIQIPPPLGRATPSIRVTNEAYSHVSQIEPDPVDFMTSIRDVAAFAWAITGINGSLKQYSHGSPVGHAVPESMPVWSTQDDGSNGNGNGNGRNRHGSNSDYVGVGLRDTSLHHHDSVDSGYSGSGASLEIKSRSRSHGTANSSPMLDRKNGDRSGSRPGGFPFGDPGL